MCVGFVFVCMCVFIVNGDVVLCLFDRFRCDVEYGVEDCFEL